MVAVKGEGGRKRVVAVEVEREVAKGNGGRMARADVVAAVGVKAPGVVASQTETDFLVWLK